MKKWRMGVQGRKVLIFPNWFYSVTKMDDGYQAQWDDGSCSQVDLGTFRTQAEAKRKCEQDATVMQDLHG